MNQPAEAGALFRLSRALAIQPDFKSGLQMIAVHLQTLGQTARAIAAFEHAFALDPDDPNGLAGLAHALRQAGHSDLAARAAERVRPESPAFGFARYVHGALALEVGDLETARLSLEAAVAADPGQRNAHLHLADLLQALGRPDEARQHQIQAMRLAGDFAELPAEDMEEARILFTCSVTGADLPIGFLFDRRRFAQLFTFPQDHGALSVIHPACDVIFNAIADPDLGGADLAAAAAFLNGTDRPVLNHPAAIPATRRDFLRGRIADIPHVAIPETRRLDKAGLAAFGRSKIKGEFLLRTAGTHGGDDLIKIVAAEEALDYLAQYQADHYYLSPFHDYRSPDGQYRKYRLIFIDREVHPYHLAIMDHWKVHYFRTDMAQEPWKREEEAHFLADHRKIFGPEGAMALDAIARRLDLDYGGIDCSRLQDGRVLVFEANAAMLVHLDDPAEIFPYKHRFVPRIQAAMSALILKRTKTEAT